MYFTVNQGKNICVPTISNSLKFQFSRTLSGAKTKFVEGICVKKVQKVKICYNFVSDMTE